MFDISLILPLDSRAFSTFPGINSSSCRIYLKSVLDIVPLLCANFKAINVSKVIWVVNAFVEATPISGPAWV